MLETYMEERLFKTSVATPFSSCSNMNTWNSLHHDHHFHHLSPSLSSEDGVSISNSLVTNASQSPHELNIGPASSAASTNFLGEGPSENHPWSQVLQYMETDLSALSSKHHPSEMIETPSNYLDKVDRSWDFTCLPSNYCNKTEKKLSNYYDMSSIKHGIVANSAEVVNNWSINPPLDPDVGHQLAPVTSNENQNLMQCYELGLLNKHQYVMPEMPRSLTRHTDYLNKPFTEVQTSNMINLNLRSPLFLDNRQDISSARGNSRGPGPVNNHNGKKKKSEDTSDAHSKKPKQEFPKALSNKDEIIHLQVNVPKAKLGERISALQQIVSPFGKTDTASVLFEAIGYIKFLQEQVQLLTSPYLKSNDHNSRGGLELKSRGLCLAPISCTPQIFREYNGPDYLTPSHSGCLYR